MTYNNIEFIQIRDGRRFIFPENNAFEIIDPVSEHAEITYIKDGEKITESVKAFTDRANLKKDTVELASKSMEKKSGNFFSKMLKYFRK